MSFLFTTICSFTGIIPLIIGIKKYKFLCNQEPIFFTYLIIAFVVEVLGHYFIWTRHINLSNYLINFFVLYEGIVMPILLFQWGAIQKGKTYVFIFLFVSIWVADNIILHSIKDVNGLSIVIYSLFIAVSSINLLLHYRNSKISTYFKQPLTILAIGLNLNYSYRAVFESLYTFKINLSNEFYLNAFYILVLLNVILNCSFTFAILQMQRKKRLYSFY